MFFSSPRADAEIKIRESRQFSLDILRASAISLVFFFHLQIPGFAWGYLGVDLFLFLSGFLVSNQLSLFNERERKYERFVFLRKRIFRIFKPIILFIPIIWLVSILFIVPSSLEVSFTVTPFPLILSNYFFANEVNYFGESAYSVLLLHFWSLGVELFFYVFLFVLSINNHLIKTISISVVILLLSLDFLVGDKNYYSILSHAFPFFCGCYLASDSRKRLLLFGFLAMSVFALLLVRSDSLMSAVVALGGVFGVKVLSDDVVKVHCSDKITEIVTWISTRAYELYLVHWPIIVVWCGMTLNSHLNYVEVLILFSASVICAELLYQFRIRANKKILIGGLVLTICVQLHTVSTDGMRFRLDSRFEVYGNHKLLQADATSIERLTAEFGEKVGATQLLVIGDSHARHFATLVDRAGESVRYLKTDLPRLVSLLKNDKSLLDDVGSVVIAFHWSGEVADDVLELISLPMLSDEKFSVLSEIPNSKRNFVRCFLSENSSLLIKKCSVSVSEMIAIDEFENLRSEQNRMIKTQKHIDVLHWEDALCDAETKKCRFLYQEAPIYRDNSHLSEILPAQFAKSLLNDLKGGDDAHSD